MSGDAYEAARLDMVERQIRRRGIGEPRVLDAMANVPRHRFVSAQHRHLSYADSALPIASGQTISQPYMVAAMTEALDLPPDSRVLEVGTGSGYQTAVLAELAAEVFTIERVSALAASATGRKRSMLSAIEQLMFFWLNPSEAAPKMATSSTRAARAAW